MGACTVCRKQITQLTAKYWGPRVFRLARFPHTDAALICCICCWSCWAILFCSLSFWVSANFTTMGDEQPYENIKTKGSNSFFRDQGDGSVSKGAYCKLDDLSWIPEAHRVEREDRPLQIALISASILWMNRNTQEHRI